MADSVDVLWSHVLEAWSDDKRHEAFLALCVETGRLADAAKRYRAIAEAPDGGDDGDARREDAKRRLGGIAILAMSSLDASKTAPDTGRIMFGVRVFAALFLLVALASLAFVLASR